MVDELQGALSDLDSAKKGVDESYARLRGVQTPATKRWTVRAPDGTEYHGVQAPTLQDAIAKMRQGPQGPLAPKPVPAPIQRPGDIGPLDVAKGVASAAAGPAVMAMDIAGQTPGERPKTTGREILADLVPLAVGAAVPQGRTLSRFLGTLGGNVAGRAGVEAGAEALFPTGKGPLAAGVQGGVKGVLPGLTQGGLGAILGPTKDTIRVQKAAQALKGAVSPEVAAHIDPSKPASLLSRNTTRKMTKAAGANLDKAEADVEKALGEGFRFKGVTAGGGQGPALYTASGLRIPGGLPGVGSQGDTFSELRSKIKELRDIGARQYSSPEMSETARSAMKDARKLEDRMLAQMPPKIAEMYRRALTQHASDSDAIRWVKGLQQENAIRGGVNPQDRPALAAAEAALPRVGGGARGAIHGTLGALEALGGRPIGAGYHLGRTADVLASKGPLRPAQRVSGPVSAITRGVGALGGVGTARAQSEYLRSQRDAE